MSVDEKLKYRDDESDTSIHRKEGSSKVSSKPSKTSDDYDLSELDINFEKVTRT